MVQSRKQTFRDPDGSVDLERWLAQLPEPLSVAKQPDLREVCEWLAERSRTSLPVALRDWPSGTNMFAAGLEIASILADLRVDRNGVYAGLLLRAVQEGHIAVHEVEARLGAQVSRLIADVTRLSELGSVSTIVDTPVLGQAEAQKDTIRKMLISLVDDVRVALIKLAERTCALRHVKSDPARSVPIAREVADVYAPMAHRLGIGQLRWELEDLSFRYLHTDAYHKIAKLLDGRRQERDEFIERVRRQLAHVLREQGVECQINGRAKHIYSIWRKMQRKGIGFSQVYDIRAIRILVPETRDCYAALGLVHGLWRNIPKEFDDYIANPKENGYRSLHTAVIGPEGKILEVQIRTDTMHEEAELGVCAHWRYKGSDAESRGVNSYEEKISWLRRVLDWHEESGVEGEAADQFVIETQQDRIYVFTPRGDVVSLAVGATPLDFAYHVHTEVGHCCLGARVNGNIVPLTYELKTGERVEILRGKEPAPKRDWLRPSLGYLRTSRARAKVQAWFRAQAREQNIDAGQRLLDREFRRLALTSVDYQLIARRLHQNSVEDLYAAVGSGDLQVSQVLNIAQQLLEGKPKERSLPVAKRKAKSDAGVSVSGVGNLLTHYAGCCKPVPGDAIAGFITRDRGVSVHRLDCHRFLDLQTKAAERVVAVEWGDEPAADYEADIEITAYDRYGLLRDITALFATAKVNVIAVNTQTHRDTNTASMRLTVVVRDLDALARLLDRLAALSNVISARRVLGEHS
jgi:GTP pyrophosphokinase